ncbi:GNAT family N-acetyltransferase [Patescibacteria group bacterium]|nr:GNAT family N-acetyltransferase [Patescibacteria group bacterium]
MRSLKRFEREKIKPKMQNIINGERIYLRELNQEDISPEYCNWLNDPMVNKFLETKKTTIEELKQYVKEKKENSNCLFLGIFLKENNKHIGNIKLEPIDFNNKRATIGILIGNKDYWGKGIAAEATKLLVNYAFNSLDLKEVNLGVISENKAAIKVYKKVGFKIDRIEKKSTMYGNKYYDGIIMSINKDKALIKRG